MSQPILRVVASPGQPLLAEVRSIALIGNFPPRRCGIATFTADVYAALHEARPDNRCDVYALTDIEGAYDYPEEVTLQIRQNERGDYLKAADRLNVDRPDLICVQHEFGIFGGPAGEYLLTLLEATDLTVVSILHTILETPNDDQRRVFSKLLARSARLVVMAHRGREILQRVWGVPAEKIVIIPHGAPDRPLSDPGPFKEALGFAGRDLLFTFGLLSPGKGIESAVKALPRIVAERPNVTYAVLGATHPHLIAHEGERYRDSLLTLARELGVEDHFQLIDAYTDTQRLVEYLQAADIYITPYLNPEQITSGTLAYAAALGRPIVSTPYWHAEELLADGRGRLTPFGSSDAIADEVIDLLTHPDVREGLSRMMYDAGRETIWARFGAHMFEAFDQVAAQHVRYAALRRPGSRRLPIAPSLGGMRRMTDTCGMLQHSLFSLPDRRHGYCVDDNARALLLMHQLPGAPDAERSALTSVYAAFVAHAWNDGEGTFRNFMSYERQWLESKGSEDSAGRATWAVGVTAARAHDAGHRRWAASLMASVLPHMQRIASPRANAFILLGLCAMAEADSTDAARWSLIRDKADALVALVEPKDGVGLWFEPYLSYDNARLPEAVIRAGYLLGDIDMIHSGLSALDWLCRRQTCPKGLFLPVATVDFGRPLDSGNLYDQQPVEAAATVDACEAAWRATGDQRWIDVAQRAYAWFFGANTLGAALATADGDCFDGLTWAGVNENRGAESVLSLQLATCSMSRLTDSATSPLKSVGDL
jgi:glycosyltransferase involved in cell wall biosynthesis